MGPPWGAFCQITLTSCFTKLGKMTGADKVMNPQHFGRDLADIRIQINPAIQIGIPDRFWLKSWCWRRFASLSTVLLCLCSCVVGHRWIVSKLLNKSNLYTWYGVDEGTVMLNGGSVPPKKIVGSAPLSVFAHSCSAVSDWYIRMMMSFCTVILVRLWCNVIMTNWERRRLCSTSGFKGSVQK